MLDERAQLLHVAHLVRAPIVSVAIGSVVTVRTERAQYSICTQRIWTYSDGAAQHSAVPPRGRLTFLILSSSVAFLPYLPTIASS